MSELAFALPTSPARPDLYNDFIDSHLVDPDSERTAGLLRQYLAAELNQLDAAWSASEPPAAEGSPWLTNREAAERARRVKPNGTPRDSFYKVIKEELGDVNRIHVDELDNLIKRGRL